MQIMRALLRAGADVNAVDVDGKTALRVAINGYRYPLAVFLLDHGADVNIRDVNYGETFLIA